MGKKIFFSQVLTSALPLPTCKNLALYEALNRSSADVEETHPTFIFTMKFTVYVRGNSLGISLLLLIIFNKKRLQLVQDYFISPVLTIIKRSQVYYSSTS